MPPVSCETAVAESEGEFIAKVSKKVLDKFQNLAHDHLIRPMGARIADDAI